MEIPSAPRYRFATQMALETFSYFNVLSFPLDVKALIKAEGIKLKKYSTIAKKIGITIEQVCQDYQTDLAYIFRTESGQYSIAYNDTKADYLIRFSLAHELGHYALRHLEDFDETILQYRGDGLTEQKYDVLEKEANCFARNLLAPAPIASIVPQEMYQEYFGIGYYAEMTRLNLLGTDTHYSNLTISEPAKKALKKIRSQILRAFKCITCNVAFHKKEAKFCPLCRSETLVKLTATESIRLKAKGDYMKYSSIQLNSNGFPPQCPRCENEDIDVTQKFCQICATYLSNICIGHGPFDKNPFEPYPSFELYKEENGCGKKLPGFARYCPDCGGLSSYFNQELLSFWQNEKEAQELIG